MKPYPHVVVEGYNTFMKRLFNGSDPRFPMTADTWLKSFFDHGVWGMLKDVNFYPSLESTAVFDFSDYVSRVDQATYHRNYTFALSLLEAGAFILPFEDMYILTGSGDSVRIFTVSGDVIVVVMAGVNFQRKDGSVEYGLSVPISGLTGIQYFPDVIANREIPDKKLSARCLLGEMGLKYFHGFDDARPVTERAAAIEKLSVDYTAMALSCIASLMSPMVAATETPAPLKLNASRESRGKPRINARYEITLRDKTLKRNEGLPQRTHASPIPHWRRGHIRRRGTLLVPVVPHVVGCGGAEAPEIGKKLYNRVYAKLNEGRI